MKKIYALLIAIAIGAFGKQTNAQSGSSCSNAIPVTPTATCTPTSHSTTDSVVYLSFIATSPYIQINVVSSIARCVAGGHPHQLTLFGGTCAALQTIEDEFMPDIAGCTELTIDASNLTTGNTYYIRVSRGDIVDSNCTAQRVAGAICFASQPLSFQLCVRSLNIIIPKDFGLEPAAIGHAYHTNKGQIVDVNGNPRFDIRSYTNNSSPAVYHLDTVTSFVFASIDTIESTPDTLHRVDMTLVGGNNSSRPFKTEKISSNINYFLAHVPTGATNIKGYSRTVKNDVYPNIDMQYYSNDVGVKFNFIIKPGGNGDNIVLNFAGANSVNVTASGGLDIVTSLGTLNFEAGHAYQINPAGNIVPMPWQAKFIQLSPTTVKFDIRSYPVNFPLFIQVDRGHVFPTNIQNLEWSTFVGGGGTDIFLDSKTDNASNLYITGYSIGGLFPVSTGAYQGTNAGNRDAIALKFNPDGSRKWATYFGGSSVDNGMGVAADANGNIFVLGQTISKNLPTTGGNPGGGAYYQQKIDTSVGSGFWDLFMLKLDSTGQTAPWRTYYGGGGNEYGNGIATDGSNIFITGQTESNNFPVQFGAGLYNQNLAGPYTLDRDAFIVKFSGATLDNVWATYYGGDSSGVSEEGKDITVDWQGNVWVTGRTPSADFPKLNPGGSAYFDGILGGGGDAFLLKFSNAGVRQYATFYGGSGYETGNSVITDGGLGVFFTGNTTSTDFPFKVFGTGYIDSTIGSTTATDAFLVHLDGNLARQWATYYGGDTIDDGLDLDVDNTNGIISLTGNTQSNNLPIVTPPNSYTQSYIAGSDIYIASFDGFFLNNVWSTYLGGSGGESGTSIVSDANSKLFITGYTSSDSATFPLDNGGGIPYYQGVYGGGTDGCITRFDIIPVVGVNEINISESDIFIFPNPASEQLNVTFSNKNNSSVKFIVYNTLGETVHSVNLGKKSGISSYIFNTSNLNMGAYFIQMQTENGTASKMFVKY